MPRAWDEIRDVLDQVQYRDWKFLVKPAGAEAVFRGPPGGPRFGMEIPVEARAHYLQIAATDPETGESWTSRKWLLSEHMTDTELVSTAWKAVLAAEEHEARERFAYAGQAVFSPHLSVDQLATLHAAAAFDVRPDAMSGA